MLPLLLLLTVLKISPENSATLQKLGDYPDLEVLSLSCLETLKALPESIGQLSKLRELIIDNGNGCTMNARLPQSIANLRQLQKLVLFGAAERTLFPGALSQLKSLTYLDIGRNGLKQVPSFVKDLPRLRELRLQYNELSDLPAFLNDLPNLTRVVLGDNCSLSGNPRKQAALKRRFPRITFDFSNDYDCPE